MSGNDNAFNEKKVKSDGNISLDDFILFSTSIFMENGCKIKIESENEISVSIENNRFYLLFKDKKD